MEAFSLWLESGGVLITTFGHASLLDLDQQIQIDMLVVDERILDILYNKKQIFSNFAKDSVVADQSNQAVDGSDKDIISKIVRLEAERYGLVDKG